MSASVEIVGLDDLIRDLRNLPRELADEASVIIERAATTAYNQISANYAAHQVTGNLVNHMRQTEQRSTFGTSVNVSNTAKHAYWYENGTNARHYYTKKNGVKHMVGAMPPRHAFIPVISRNRIRMYDELKRLMERHGLEVKTDASA